MNRREFIEQGSRAAVGAALMPLGTLAARQSVTLPSLIAFLDKELPVWMKAAKVPGLSIAIIHDARVAWRRGFGLTDAGRGGAVTLDTMFEAASMSKPVFAYVVLKLCEDGVLSLDTPLTRYTTDRFLAGDARLDLITPRQILSHTSGFQNWRSDKSPLAIHFTPGSQYLYSGEGYNYLQTVVTLMLKQPFEAYMRERLFVPFGMSSSRYVWDDTAGRRMARPHDSDGRVLDHNRSSAESVARYGSAGALLTTPTDYAKFVIGVINPPPADTFHLTPRGLGEMVRPHVKMDGTPFPASWALGWQVFHNPGRDFIYHGGDNRGFHCAAVASVAGRSGFVAMTNGDRGPEVLRSLLSADVMQAFLSA